MLFNEFIESLSEKSIDIDNVKEFSTVYESDFNDFVNKILSCLDKTIFFDDGEKRLLSKNEVLNASEFLQIDFISKKMIPLFDFYDNDFLVYCYSSKKWEMFNIVDDCSFDVEDDIAMVLK